MAIVTIGIDLAKNGFAVHGVEETGRSVLIRPKVPRAKLIELITALPPGRIGREAYSGAHHWARHLNALGIEARLLPAAYTRTYDLMQPMLAYSYKQRVARLLSRIGYRHRRRQPHRY